jgi:hypothetical protein
MRFTHPSKLIVGETYIRKCGACVLDGEEVPVFSFVVGTFLGWGDEDWNHTCPGLRVTSQHEAYVYKNGLFWRKPPQTNRQAGWTPQGGPGRIAYYIECPMGDYLQLVPPPRDLSYEAIQRIFKSSSSELLREVLTHESLQIHPEPEDIYEDKA